MHPCQRSCNKLHRQITTRNANESHAEQCQFYHHRLLLTRAWWEAGCVIIMCSIRPATSHASCGNKGDQANAQKTSQGKLSLTCHVCYQHTHTHTHRHTCTSRGMWRSRGRTRQDKAGQNQVPYCTAVQEELRGLAPVAPPIKRPLGSPWLDFCRGARATPCGRLRTWQCQIQCKGRWGTLENLGERLQTISQVPIAQGQPFQCPLILSISKHPFVYYAGRPDTNEQGHGTAERASDKATRFWSARLYAAQIY